MVALAVLIGQVQAFGADANFAGDGEFTDPMQRFLRDLGRVNLNQNGELWVQL
jgi:hypothetical protein